MNGICCHVDVIRSESGIVNLAILPNLLALSLWPCANPDLYKFINDFYTIICINIFSHL